MHRRHTPFLRRTGVHGHTHIVVPDYWTPLELTTPPVVYCICDTAYLTRTPSKISAWTNLGTLGGSFAQGTDASRPSYQANYFGSGKHAAQFSGGQQMTLSHAIASQPVITVFSIGVAAPGTTARVLLGWGDGTATPRHEIWHGCQATPEWYALHQTNVGYSARRSGYAANATKRLVITQHDISSANPEATVWVDDDSSLNVNVLTGNNTTAFNGTWNYTLGTRANGTGSAWIGHVRAFGVVLGTLTADDRTELMAWADRELAR